MNVSENDPLNLIITGVGGQGNVLISRFIGEALVMSGYQVTVGETYGASQRGGPVSSHIRISRDTQYGAITPAGLADVILGLEPMESLRILGAFGAPKTFVITNTRPIHTMAVATGEAEYPGLESIKQAVGELSQKAWYIDATEIAINLGVPLIANMVMLGALVGLGLLPLARDKMEEQLRTSFKGERLALNTKAFAAGLAEISRGNQSAA